MRKRSLFTGLMALTALSVSISGCGDIGPKGQKLDIKTDYQAVLLDNGQAYFGKVEQGSDFLLLKEVYYIQSKVDESTKAVSSVLIKRGVQEWHAPDSMYINKEHIVIVEPVADTSKVAELIKSAKAKEGQN
ncbi:hypothetical protein BAC1_01287 [uncultured bacterium]|nr:hypothetical protein BAC1_01287 [uncultured bacterium]